MTKINPTETALVVGVDPDTHGWIVIGRLDGTITHAGPLVAWLDAVRGWTPPPGSVAYVEDIPYVPRKGQIAARVQGEVRGRAVQALRSAGCRVVPCGPQQWQRSLGITVRGRELGQYARRKLIKAKIAEFVRTCVAPVEDRHAIDAHAIWEYGRRAERLMSMGRRR